MMSDNTESWSDSMPSWTNMYRLCREVLGLYGIYIPRAEGPRLYKSRRD